MSNFLHTNEYVMKYADGFNRISQDCSICEYNGHFIELVGTKRGYESIISVLRRSEQFKRVIGLGFFGSIRESLKKGEILIPTKAIPLPKVPLSEGIPDKKLAMILLKKSKQLGNTHLGLIATSPQTIKQETKQVKSLRKQGVVGIDMETSCFFSTLNSKSAASGALLICSDNIILRPLSRIPQNQDQNLPLGIQTAIKSKKAVLLAIKTLLETI